MNEENENTRATTTSENEEGSLDPILRDKDKDLKLTEDDQEDIEKKGVVQTAIDRLSDPKRRERLHVTHPATEPKDESDEDDRDPQS